MQLNWRMTRVKISPPLSLSLFLLSPFFIFPLLLCLFFTSFPFNTHFRLLSLPLSLSIRTPHMKVLTRYISIEFLLPPLFSILTRHNLPLSPTPWQDVATSALSLLTSTPLSKTLLPEQLDEVIITSLPLLFVHRRGNRLAGGMASVLWEADHVLVNCLRDLMENDGQ